jgi:curli production assembly/transport component CsgG
LTKNILIALIGVLYLSGCASIAIPGDEMCKTDFLECVEEPKKVELPTYRKLRYLPPAEVMPVVAIYQFGDGTGQRKSQDGVASFSTAVTQDAKSLLVDALKAAGSGSDAKGTWFRVVERGLGLDNLVRERQIVRSTRSESAKQAGLDEFQELQPMLFAGMILEGGVIGYDTNIETGGTGARYLGIGTTNQYRRDSIVISLRAVSTLTGEVILNVQTQKTVLSSGQAGDVFRFVDMDTRLLELIRQGDERGYWKIVYPEDWDQQVAEQEEAYWMSLKQAGNLTDERDEEQFSKDPNDLPLWKRILLKNDNKTNIGENNEDN